jgi:hypothetical protein
MIAVVTRWCVLSTALSLVVSAAGCSPGDSGLPKQQVHPVSGSVTYKGKPVEGVRVSIVAVQAADGRRFNSEPFTNAEGKFQCGTYTANDGLPTGMYEVRLTWPERPNDDQRDLEQDRLRGRYNSQQKPAFTVEVKAETNTVPPFELK